MHNGAHVRSLLAIPCRLLCTVTEAKVHDDYNPDTTRLATNSSSSTRLTMAAGMTNTSCLTSTTSNRPCFSIATIANKFSTHTRTMLCSECLGKRRAGRQTDASKVQRVFLGCDTVRTMVQRELCRRVSVARRCGGCVCVFLVPWCLSAWMRCEWVLKLAVYTEH